MVWVTDGDWASGWLARAATSLARPAAVNATPKASMTVDGRGAHDVVGSLCNSRARYLHGDVAEGADEPGFSGSRRFCMT